MKFEKIMMPKTEFALIIGKHTIPISAISAMFRPLLILVILYFAYQIGQTDAIIKQYNHKIIEIQKDCKAPVNMTFNFSNGVVETDKTSPS